MRKYIVCIVLMLCGISAFGQEYINQIKIWKNGTYSTINVAEVDSVTFVREKKDSIPQSITTDEFVATEKDVQMMVSAMYNQFRYFLFYEQEMENMAINESFYPINANNATFEKAWNYGYRTIYYANNIVGKIQNANSLENKKGYLAQAKCMRSIVHYMMAQLWGDVPYVDKLSEADEEINVVTQSYNLVVKSAYDTLQAYYGELYDFKTENAFSSNNIIPLMNEASLYVAEGIIAYKQLNEQMVAPMPNGTDECTVVDSVFNQLLMTEVLKMKTKAELGAEWMQAMPRYGVWNALKRMGLASPKNGMASSLLFPIPNRVIQTCPNIQQNAGY